MLFLIKRQEDFKLEFNPINKRLFVGDIIHNKKLKTNCDD